MILLTELHATLSQKIPAPTREGEIRRIPLMISSTIWALHDFPPKNAKGTVPIREVVLRAEVFQYRDHQWLEWEVVEISGMRKEEAK